MSWLRTSTAIGAALAIGCGATACGGSSGPRTFSAKGIDLSFTYPPDLHPANLKSIDLRAGATAVAHGVVGVSATHTSRDFLLITRYALHIPVNPTEVPKLRAAADQVVSQLGSGTMTGSPVQIAGRPGLEFPVLHPRGAIAVKIYYLFVPGSVVAGTAYELNCQWEDHPAVIQRACQQMLRTIKVK
jgi:hypothetical protein